MTTLREVAQQALEWLDEEAWPGFDEWVQEGRAIRDALRAALAEPGPEGSVEVELLQADLDRHQQTIIEMGAMLRAIVNLIRGEPPEGESHSTHDAVELVRGLVMHNDLYVSAATHEASALRTKNEALRDSCEAKADRIDRLGETVERLKAENEALARDYNAARDAHDKRQAENDALRAALAEPALQTCNCRWDGEVQVQQCTLHEAHVDAIHEWAERAKVAEKKLAALAEPTGKDHLQDQPVAWSPIEQPYPQDSELDILMKDGSILCAVFPQADGDLWWGGAGTGEKFIDPNYANVTHWRIHSDTHPAPQRQPLTDEEIEDLYFDKFSIGELKVFARAIEQAHGIGGQDEVQS